MQKPKGEKRGRIKHARGKGLGDDPRLKRLRERSIEVQKNEKATDPL